MIDWQAIALEHGPLVWRTAYRLLGSARADAADCFQETFLTALGVAQKQEVRNWPGMLQRIATSRALDILRRRKREAAHRTAGPEWADIGSTVATDTAGPDRQAENAELMDRLREGLTHLPPQHSEVFCLRNFEGLSYEAIAEQLEIPVNTVGVALHRATARLRDLLAPAGAEGRPMR